MTIAEERLVESYDSSSEVIKGGNWSSWTVGGRMCRGQLADARDELALITKMQKMSLCDYSSSVQGLMPIM